MLSGLRRLGLPVLLAYSACSEDPVTNLGRSDFSVLVGEGGIADAGASAIGDLARMDAPNVLDLGLMPDVSTDFGVPDAGNPCLQSPELELSPAEAARRAQELEGVLVRITATASVGPVSCIERPCPNGSTCCHPCRAPQSLGPLRLVGGMCAGTSTIGCFGSPCSPLVCTPPALGFEASYVGRVRAEGTPSLELFRVGP